MSRLKLKRPSVGTVLGMIALIVAIAGNTGALAGTRQKITKADLAKGAVTARALASGAVTARALASGAVTARALARGAVKSQAITQGAVTSTALAPGAVGAGALAPDSVTPNAVAPESIHGYALGPVVVHSTPIADLDTAPDNNEWTASSSESATCGTGERLLSGGVVFTNPGNREVGIIESLPVSNGSANAWVGQITSNSGGTAAAEVQAICLK